MRPPKLSPEQSARAVEQILMELPSLSEETRRAYSLDPMQVDPVLSQAWAAFFFVVSAAEGILTNDDWERCCNVVREALQDLEAYCNTTDQHDSPPPPVDPPLPLVDSLWTNAELAQFSSHGG